MAKAPCIQTVIVDDRKSVAGKRSMRGLELVNMLSSRKSSGTIMQNLMPAIAPEIPQLALFMSL